MNKNLISPKIEELRRTRRLVKRQIESQTAELNKVNESLQAEISQRKRTEEELGLLLRISQEITAADDFLSSVVIALRRVCESTGWAGGEAWVPCSDGTALEFSHGWYGKSKAFERFKQSSEDFRFPPGVGVPGQVWASKQPEWVQDISAELQEKHPRCKLAKDFGLKSVLGVPILANDEILAVLVFFMSEAHEEDKRLVEIVSSVAVQLGSALRHKRTEQTLRELALLEAIIDNSTSVIWLKDREGRYHLINREYEQLFRISREQVQGKTDYDLFSKHIADDFRANDLKVMEAGAPMEFEESAPQDDGIHTYISNRFPMRDANGKVYAVCGIATDITKRKREEQSLKLRVQERTAALLEVNHALQRVIAEHTQAKEALSKSEGRYYTMADALPVLVWQSGPDKLCTYFNNGWLEFTGRTTEQELGNGWVEGVHPDDLRQCLEIYASAFERREPFVMEYRLRHRFGDYRWVLDRGAPIYGTGGTLLGYIGGCVDIHDRKLAEEALRNSREELRTLASGLQAANEAERSVLAREIHDELSGTLTALKMDISLLPDRAAKDCKLFLEKLGSMSELIDRTLARVHTIVTELRPAVLDKLGLVAAIEWQTGEFQDRSGIMCEIHLPTEEIPLDPERSTAVFRIFQEALTNVARHAHATKVVVDLRIEAGNLILAVRDNGRGIDEKLIFDQNSLGLLGMRERALSFGGTAEVSRLPQGGALVTARIPIG